MSCEAGAFEADSVLIRFIEIVSLLLSSNPKSCRDVRFFVKFNFCVANFFS